MNQRKLKKKDKRSCLGISDEINIIGMNQDELQDMNEDRERYRKKYGYRKKYKSKKKLRIYYIMPSERQIKQRKKFMNGIAAMSGRSSKPVVVVQDFDQLKKAYDI
jgi:hypothetical protein